MGERSSVGEVAPSEKGLHDLYSNCRWRLFSQSYHYPYSLTHLNENQIKKDQTDFRLKDPVLYLYLALAWRSLKFLLPLS